MSGKETGRNSPVEEVGSLGKDAVLGDPEAQCGAKHQHCWQPQVEVLPEQRVTQEPGSQVRQDHQQRVEEHLALQPKPPDWILP